jgi:hypothetical protein
MQNTPYQQTQSGSGLFRFRVIAFRLLAALLGIMFVVLAPIVYQPDSSLWPRWALIFSQLITGIYFIFYGITGHSNLIGTLFKRKQ